LQQYLATELTRLAMTPTLDDVIRRIDTRSGGRVGLAQAAETWRVSAPAGDRRRRHRYLVAAQIGCAHLVCTPTVVKRPVVDSHD
jgi:hypothetical protein